VAHERHGQLGLAGTKTTGVVRCDQPRAIDLDARNARRVESVPESIMDEVLAKAGTIFA
jgi:mRNA interferase ChpB